MAEGRRELERACFKLRHLQEIGHEVRHTVSFLHNAQEKALLHSRVQLHIGLQKTGGIAFNSSQRSTEFVRDDGEQILLHLLGLILHSLIIENLASSDQLTSVVTYL